MIIDGHGHSCCGYATLENIQKHCYKNNIDKVILFPAEVGKLKVDKIPNIKNVLHFSNVVGKYLSKLFKLSDKIDFGNTYVFYMKQLEQKKIIQFYQVTPKYLEKMENDYD